jgi:hypothetical protein
MNLIRLALGGVARAIDDAGRPLDLVIENVGARRFPSPERRKRGSGWARWRAMGFRDLRRRMTASVAQLDQARLQERYQGLGVTPIGSAPLRVPVRLGGEVQETRVVPRTVGTPTLEITIADGTGRATAVFTGTKHIGGLALGEGVLLEGVARQERGRTLLLNPAYTLL